MDFYWSARSVPELRHLSPVMRWWVVNRALTTMRVSVWSGLAVVGFFLINLAIGVVTCVVFLPINFTLVLAVSLTFGLTLCFLLLRLLLNLARPRIRELLKEIGPDQIERRARSELKKRDRLLLLWVIGLAACLALLWWRFPVGGWFPTLNEAKSTSAVSGGRPSADSDDGLPPR